MTNRFRSTISESPRPSWQRAVAWPTGMAVGRCSKHTRVDRYHARRSVGRTLTCLAFTFLMLPFLALVGTSSARELYVNNLDGNDRFDGTTPAATDNSSGPFRSIARALRAAKKGDRVIVANTGQPYRESITLQGGRHSGLPHRPFELIGNGATLDGTSIVPASGWLHAQGQVFRFRPPKTSYQMVYLNEKPAPRQQVNSLEQLSDLKPLHWTLIDQHIFFCVEPNRLPQSYDISFAKSQVGITLYQVRHLVVQDFVVQGFQLDGVNAHDGVVATELVKMNCRGNGRSGISIGGASRITVQSCLVGNNGAAQIRTEGFSHTQLVGCDLLDNTAPKIVRTGGKVQVTQ